MKQDRGDKMDDTKITVTTPDNKTFQVEVLIPSRSIRYF